MTQSCGLSLVSITRSPTLGETADTTILAVPSRFPKSSSLLTAVSPTGHVYLYAENGAHVWEYDARGRRVSELSFQGQRVQRVLGLGVEVIVALDGGIKVMEKEGGKWREVNTLEVGRGVRWGQWEYDAYGASGT